MLPDGVLNTNNVTSSFPTGRLGINAAGTDDDAGEFDNGESWTFSWDEDLLFRRIDLGSFTNVGDKQFTISSNSLGVLSFTDLGDTEDIFNVSDSTFIPANEQITILYSATSGGAVIENMTFSSIPEPSVLFGTLVPVGGLVLRRRRAR